MPINILDNVRTTMTNFFYNQYSSAQAQTLEEQEKSKDFLKRIEPFKEVKTFTV